MLEKFWDQLYPELENGDAELRAGPLAWWAATSTPAFERSR